jgi:hypothetical protein
MKEQENNTVSIVPFKRKITTVQKQVEGFKITDNDTMVVATDTLSIIKDISKAMEKQRKLRVDPLNKEVKDINAEYKPLSTDLEKAEKYIKSEMISYSNEVDRKAAEAAAKLEARVEKGTMRTDTAMRKMDDIETMGSSVEGNKGSINFRMVRVVKIVDVTKIPAKYLNDEKVLDAIKSAVRTDVMNGTLVDGVEVVEEKQIAAK